nr:hypothetical protein [Tanacetum cinerariifolium]
VNSEDADNSRPIFDSEPLQKVPNNDNYNVFAIESEHPEQSKSVNDTYPIEQDEHNVIIDSLDSSHDREHVDQDDDDDLANERDLLASLIEKLQCEIDDSKNSNKFLETSNKVLVDKLQGRHRVYDMRKFLALDSALQVSQTFAILVVVEVRTEHSLDDWKSINCRVDIVIYPCENDLNGFSMTASLYACDIVYTLYLYACALWWMEMERTLALVDVDRKMLMLDLVDHFGCMLTTK